MSERGTALYQLTLLVLSLYVLTVLVIEAFFVSDPETRQVLQYIDVMVCLVFLSDFFVNLYVAPKKLEYLKWGWIDLVSSIPMVDPLRWGRLARVVRILRFLRAVRSFRVIYRSIMGSKFQSLTLVVFVVVFFSYTVCASMILEFERPYNSPINSAEAALWWALLNVLNAKVALTQAISPEGILATVLLNKIGLLIFAYINASIVAWLISRRTDTNQQRDTVSRLDDT